MPKRDAIFAYVLPIAALLAPFLLYLRTLAPAYIPIDSAEFALCMKYWGICHPPGFPLYIAIGHFFSKFFPFGTLIYKANLLSAIFGAGTVLLIYLCLLELKVNRFLALFAALFLAANAVFWEFSLSADVFTFSTFLTALFLLFLLKNWKWAAFFALGLSASHFYISAILFPLVYWYFWGLKIKVREGLVSGLVFGLGFFPQLVMYARMQASPQVDWGHAKSFADFLYFVRRREFGSIFLLSNPVLTFHVAKVFKQFYLYFTGLFAGFAVVLPFMSVFGILLTPTKRKPLFLLYGFLIIIFVQLFLLSTIDPTGDANPFQINKFYLSSYVFLILLVGLALEALSERFFAKDRLYACILLGVFIFVYLLSNLKIDNYSKNYFTKNMVLDAFSELPDASVAITVSHVVYFGGRYEQEVNGKFTGVRALYFPNEKNRDNESYQRELFVRASDDSFVEKAAGGKNLGAAENYILEVISKNLDKNIYILQGSFEEQFFGYLKPYIVPYGLWWKVAASGQKADPQASYEALKTLLNGNVDVGSIHLTQQKQDLATYAISYKSTGLLLASVGKYEAALELLSRAKAIDPGLAQAEGLVKSTQSLENKSPGMLAAKDEIGLLELGNNYFNLGNFAMCEQIFAKLTEIALTEAKNWNNLASCQASGGKKTEAIVNYKKALLLDPAMDIAKKGLAALGD